MKNLFSGKDIKTQPSVSCYFFLFPKVTVSLFFFLLNLFFFFNNNTQAVFFFSAIILAILLFNNNSKNTLLMSLPVSSSLSSNVETDIANIISNHPIGIILGISILSFSFGLAVPLLYNHFNPEVPPPNPIISPNSIPEPSTVTLPLDTESLPLLIPTPPSLPDPVLLSVDIANLKQTSLEAFSFIFHTVRPMLKITYKLIISSPNPRNEKLQLITKLKQATYDCDTILNDIQGTIDSLNLPEESIPTAPSLFGESVKSLMYNPNVQPQISEAIIVDSTLTTPIIESSSYLQNVTDFLLLYLTSS